MACPVRTDFLVSRVLEVSAFVTYYCVDNSSDFAQTGLYSPKTSCTKCCFFNCQRIAPLRPLLDALRRRLSSPERLIARVFWAYQERCVKRTKVVLPQGCL